MKIDVKWLDDLTFNAKGDSNHWVAMDADPKVGGGNAGSRPLELILMGLGGCTGMDVVSILKKMRAPLDKFEIEIETDRTDEHPKVFNKIHLKYIFYGKGLKIKNIERAIELSETTYCAASAMLKKATEISTSYEIREPQA
jgi:putative redox protein